MEIPVGAYDFITSPGLKLYEVRVSRATWCADYRDLDDLSFNAIRKLNRHHLDTLHDTRVKAAGRIKVFDACTHGKWVAELHQIVAVERPFDLGVLSRSRNHDDDYVTIVPVNNLLLTLRRVFAFRLCSWPDHPYNIAGVELCEDDGLRELHDEWRFMQPDEKFFVRYGADRYWNKLQKQPRAVVTKQTTKRPYPHHLVQYQYGERAD